MPEIIHKKELKQKIFKTSNTFPPQLPFPAAHFEIELLFPHKEVTLSVNKSNRSFFHA